jgi:predicted dehydrogenase
VGATHAAHAHREADGHDVEEARELELALGDHCAVAVGYVERFNPQVRQLRERLAGREVLTARFTRYNARPSADVLLDLQSHDIDLARVLGVDPAGVIYNSLAGAAEIRREIQVQWSSARPVGSTASARRSASSTPI